MTNLINDFINQKLVEGDYYFVMNPDENNKIRVMKFRIENKDEPTDHERFGVLEDVDTVFNSVYHQNLTIIKIKTPAEFKPSPTQVANRKILEKISEVVEDHPDWRFHQILWNMGILWREPSGEIADGFYEESDFTLENIENNQLTNCY